MHLHDSMTLITLINSIEAQEREQIVPEEAGWIDKHKRHLGHYRITGYGMVRNRFEHRTDLRLSLLLVSYKYFLFSGLQLAHLSNGHWC